MTEPHRLERRARSGAGRLRRLDFPVWSTTATLVADAANMAAAVAELNAEIAEIEAACSRFRADSEINALVRTAGAEVPLSAVLNDVLAAALRVAVATDYLVDPTVAAAVIAMGYDRDIHQVRLSAGHDIDLARATGSTRAAPGAWSIQHDPRRRRLLLPPGVGIDLGATAKALAADRAAERIAGRTGARVLVSIGGDVAVAGAAPEGGWRIAVADDHRTAEADPQTVVAISSGGLATSSIVSRRWTTPAGERHHIIDPRTGANPAAVWRTASVAAGSCLDANAAATAAIVLGEQAPQWLTIRRLPARLVAMDGRITVLGGWPSTEHLDDR